MANTSLNSNQNANIPSQHIGAMGAKPGATSATATGVMGPLSTETARQKASVSPARSRPPVSLQSQPSQQSLKSEHSQSHSQSQSHVRSQPSTSLTSRFAATRRPQTSQTGREPLQISTKDSSQQPHRPPQLQLQQEQPRDNTATNPPLAASSPYNAQTPGSAPPAVRQHTTEGAKRPSTKSGFFHFNKSSKGSNHLLHKPSSQEQLAAGPTDWTSAPKSASKSLLPPRPQRTAFEHEQRRLGG
jgi:hypothetical protein